MGEPTLDAVQCANNVKAIYSSWEDDEDGQWHDVGSVILGTGKARPEGAPMTLTSALQLLLFGYELTETLMMFTRAPKEMHAVVKNNTKAKLILSAKEEVDKRAGCEVVMHQYPKAESGEAEIEELVRRASEIGDTVGHVRKEQAGNLMERWEERMRKEGTGLEAVDVTAAIAELLDQKTEQGVSDCKKASILAGRVLADRIDNKVMTAIEEEQTMPHKAVAENLKEALTNPKDANVGLEGKKCSLPCEPCIHSGSDGYTLSFGSHSSTNPLDTRRGSVIVAGLGATYDTSSAAIARTILVDPSEDHKRDYAAMELAREAAINACRHNSSLPAPKEAALEALRKKEEEEMGKGLKRRGWAERLTENVGSVFGVDFLDETHQFRGKGEGDGKGSGRIKGGMAVCISVGLCDLEEAGKVEEEGKKEATTYSMWVADTVLVKEKEDGTKETEVLTTTPDATFDTAALYFQEENDEEGEGNEKTKEEGSKEGEAVKEEGEGEGGKKEQRRQASTRKTTNQPKYQKMTEMEVKTQQEQLARRKNEETYNRLKGRDGGGVEEGKGSNASWRKLVRAYREVTDVPLRNREAKEMLVDRKAEALLVPVNGAMVPFHMSTVKSVNVSSEGSFPYFRLNLQIPTGANTTNAKTKQAQYQPAVHNPNSTFVKEMSLKCSDEGHANRVMQEVRQLKKEVVQRESERADKASLKKQEKLKLMKGKAPRLADLWIRPNFGGRKKKQPGILEAHANGFKYQTPKGQEEEAEIVYSNIRHAFFHPGKKELITVIHLHLRDEIMIGKKKTKDVQFYTEVVEATTDLNQTRRAMYDPDEVEEEQREREKRNRINAEFQQFVKKVQTIWERDLPELNLEFDLTYRDISFFGVPFKEQTTLFPTFACLVDIIQFPFFVVTLEDIEVVALERAASDGIKNFDMRIVFKDFGKEPTLVSSIPMTSLENIKEWLTSVRITFYETKVNLLWKSILQNIQDDPEGFYEDGGWDFLNLDDEGGEGDDDEEEESEGFNPSDVDEEDDTEDDDEDDDEGDDDEVDEDAEENGGEEGEDDEEEGMDWDELEAQAAQEDENKNLPEESRKKRPSQASGANKKSKA